MTNAMQLRPPCPFQTDVELANKTTMGVGGKVPLLVEPRNAEEVVAAVNYLRAEGVPFRTLGGGANLLIDDAGLDDAVLLTERSQFCQREGESGLALRVSCGMPIPTFVQRACDMGLAGAECLVGIPGSMGGATAMNAGGRHGWLSHIVTRVKVLTHDGAVEELAKTDSMFAYRSSMFTDSVVLETVVELAPGDPAVIRAKRTEILKEKGAAQPLKQKSAGCIFKNPTDGSAGKLIERAGLKGLRIGAAEISPKHGNFIVNLGGASFQDIAALIREARRVVFEEFGTRLEREVKSWTRDAVDW